MKKDSDIFQDQQDARARARSGGAAPISTPQSAAQVFTDENGQPVVKRRWLVGDPWTDRYYFADYKAAEEQPSE